MQVQINGQKQQVETGATLMTLLESRRLSPNKVAVELNRRLVRSGNYDKTLSEGDEVEIVTFVGGG